MPGGYFLRKSLARMTVYAVRNTETGKVRTAHVTQIARMRTLADGAPRAAGADDQQQAAVTPPSVERLWDSLRVGQFAVIHVKGEHKSMLRVLEITQANPSTEEFQGWYQLHELRAADGHVNHERPLAACRLTPEWRKKNGQTGYIKVPKTQRHNYERVIDTFIPGEAELVVSGFNMESGGKVPRSVYLKADAWLRRAAKEEPRALVALSEPSEAEKRKITEMLKD